MQDISCQGHLLFGMKKNLEMMQYKISYGDVSHTVKTIFKDKKWNMLLKIFLRFPFVMDFPAMQFFMNKIKQSFKILTKHYFAI